MYFLIYALFTTIILEFLVIWIFLRDQPARTLIYTILINCFTLPLATYAYYYVIFDLLLVEILVIVIESLFIKLLFNIKYHNALLISVIANVITALVGVYLI